MWCGGLGGCGGLASWNWVTGLSVVVLVVQPTALRAPSYVTELPQHRPAIAGWAAGPMWRCQNSSVQSSPPQRGAGSRRSACPQLSSTCRAAQERKGVGLRLKQCQVSAARRSTTQTTQPRGARMSKRVATRASAIRATCPMHTHSQQLFPQLQAASEWRALSGCSPTHADEPATQLISSRQDLKCVLT